MAKRGRPIKEDAKRTGIRFRLKDDEMEMLNELSQQTGLNRTALFVGWLRKEYATLSDPLIESKRRITR